MIGFLLSNLWWLLAVALVAAIVFAPAAVWRLRWPLALAVVALFAGLFWLDANALRQVMAERDRADAVASLAAAGVARAIARGRGRRPCHRARRRRNRFENRRDP